tara:strand:+ start:446 stop:640 length:195 start_codon:yes stop_codon:yes gene_type:complete
MNESWPALYGIGLVYLYVSYTYYKEYKAGYGSEYEYSNIPLTKNGIGIVLFLFALIAFLIPFFF